MPVKRPKIPPKIKILLPTLTICVNVICLPKADSWSKKLSLLLIIVTGIVVTAALKFISALY